MKLTDYICFKPPTVYDIVTTIGIILAIIILWNVKNSQASMQKNYVTKDYIYNFYITKDQYQIIEDERPKYLKRIMQGEDYDFVNSEYLEFTKRVLSLRTRGEL